MEQSYRKPLRERLAHNKKVEEARLEQHQKRCKESPIYKRIYERVKSVQEQEQKVFTETMLSIQEGMKKIEKGEINKETLQKTMNKPNHISDILCFGIISKVFGGDYSFLEQMKEELPYTKEFCETEEFYNNQLEPISGWEI